MPVRVLDGFTAEGGHAAAMYCSTTGLTVGPIFEGDDPAAEIQLFLDWLREHGPTAGRELALTPLSIKHSSVPWWEGIDGADARDWSDSDLCLLVIHWRNQALSAPEHEECASATLTAARAENMRLRNALDWIAAEPENPTRVELWARAALERESPG